MNILITGGAGFIGSNFTRYWLEKYPQDIVVVYDKFTYAGNRNNLKLKSICQRQTRLWREKLKIIKGDICDTKVLEKAIANHIDTIVHFAAETHVDRSIDAPDDFIQTNIIGTFRILELMKKFPDIRLHHVSTDEVYGDLPLDKPDMKFDENSPYKPNSPYSASKAASDHLVRAYIRTYGIKATISNCSNNFGPYCFPEKLIPLAITRALNDEEIPVYGSGLQVRDWIHTEDHVRGIDLILQKGKLGETYMLGGDGERTNLWILQKILEILNKPKNLLIHVGDRKGHDERYAVDFTKAKKELLFEPEKTIEEWLIDTINWYRGNESWWRPLKKNADKIAKKYLERRLD